MVSITGVCGPVEDWKCGGVPLTMMMNMEKRHGYAQKSTPLRSDSVEVS